MEYIVNGMNCSDFKVQMGVVRCFYSFLRFVQQFRIIFQDYIVWKFFMNVSIERFNCNYIVNICNNGKVEKFGLNFIDFVNEICVQLYVQCGYFLNKLYFLCNFIRF